MYKLRMMSRSLRVVGCGGTGGFVAEGLCRLLPGDFKICLQDHDVVEEHNLRRQNFHPGDLGKFKSQALAERLCRVYGREIAYSVQPFTGEATGWHFSETIIGCVDNSAARCRIAKLKTWERQGDWWIDSGNSEHSGQVLIGNSQTGYFHDGKAFCLPLPSIQLPGLLIPAKEKLDCAQRESQSPVINQAMASLVLQFVERLVQGELAWMGAYIDLESMSLSAVPAEPRTVARLLGVKESSLIRKETK